MVNCLLTPFRLSIFCEHNSAVCLKGLLVLGWLQIKVPTSVKLKNGTTYPVKQDVSLVMEIGTKSSAWPLR